MGWSGWWAWLRRTPIGLRRSLARRRSSAATSTHQLEEARELSSQEHGIVDLLVANVPEELVLVAASEGHLAHGHLVEQNA